MNPENSENPENPENPANLEPNPPGVGERRDPPLHPIDIKTEAGEASRLFRRSYA